MILVRDVFRLRFGKAKEAKALLKEGRALIEEIGYSKPRLMTDFTGQSYTLVMETDWNSLGEWENALKTAFGNKDWQSWYQKFVPLVESGSREIYTIVE